MKFHHLPLLAIILGATALGCGFFGKDEPADNAVARTCIPPEGVELTNVDSDGRLSMPTALAAADGSMTFLICDGATPRAIKVEEVVPGNPIDLQGGIATDGQGRVLTEERLVAAALYGGTDLSIDAACVGLWKGGCDIVAPVEPPAAVTPTTPSPGT